MSPTQLCHFYSCASFCIVEVASELDVDRSTLFILTV